jgi:hypothetical protein
VLSAVVLHLHQHAIGVPGFVEVKAHHLAFVIDTVRDCHASRIPIIDSRVGILALIVEEAMGVACCVGIRADDLALVVDPERLHRRGVAWPVKPHRLLAFLHEADVVAVCADNESSDIAPAVNGGCRRAGETLDVVLIEGVRLVS